MITYAEDRTVGHREWAREIWKAVRAERETPQPETIVSPLEVSHEIATDEVSQANAAKWLKPEEIKADV